MKTTATLETALAEAPRVARLPRDPRGLPIPFVVLRDDAGNPDFIVNDTVSLLVATKLGLCAICGEELTPDDVWFIGGCGSGLDPRGLYNDGPAHHECGRFALRICPYLAIARHLGMKPTAKESVMAKLTASGRATGFIDPTMNTNKPASFIFGRAAGYAIVAGTQHPARFMPNRPFVEIEEWFGGQLLSDARPEQSDYAARMRAYRRRGLGRMKQDKVRFSTLAPVQQSAWNNGLKGHFPWDRP